jgi:XTP/dITP diphosphohydrolase
VAALADDSGLSVDALEGAPGVYSARYAPGTDADRVRKLLGALTGVPAEKRSARFVCAMAFAVPGLKTTLVEGTCEGSIGHDPRGENGFGYDPVFLVGGGPKTMAELTMSEKNAISHRGQALRMIAPTLARHFAG